MKINKKISLQNVYLKTIESQYIYPSIEESEVVLISDRGNAGLKKLSSFV
jgi:hypothetical protein